MRHEEKLARVSSQNPNNLKKMVVICSSGTTTKPSKQLLNLSAIKFKQNVDLEIQKLQSQLKDKNVKKAKILGRSQQAGVTAGARYECIYKNFLRDIRQFYSNNFDKFLLAK
jgi:hypothetical protein